MSIESLEQCYALISRSFRLNDEAIDFFEDACTNNLTQLLTFETNQIKSKEFTAMSACVSNLDTLTKLSFFDRNKYNRVKGIFCTLMEGLSLDLINSPQGALIGTTNVFTLAVDHLTSLYHHIFSRSDIHILELSTSWFKDVCVPLMERGVNVESGYQMFGQTNLIKCWIHCLPRAEVKDPMFELASYILNRGNEQNISNTSGQTPLYMGIVRGVPVVYLKELIAKGADVNAKCLSKMLGGGCLRIPLLSHCVKRKKYKELEFLLDMGADPNAMPVKEKHYISSDQNNETMVTPYQLAVAMDDAEAIACFVRYSEKKGLPLVTEIPAGATDWQTNFGNLNLVKHGVGLSLSCKNRLFRSQENMMENIYAEFGIRCYVSNPADRENVVTSLRWLAKDALHSPIAQIWRPIFNCLMKHFKENPDFAIYVSSIPTDVTKKTTCQGLMHENIYVETGLTYERYVITLVHEAAHLFDSLHLRLYRSKFQIYEHAEDFVTALTCDLQRLTVSKPLSRVLMSSRIIEATYKDDYDQEPMKEFFAYLLISDVIEFYLKDKDRVTEADVIQFLEAELPDTFKWFRTQFICPMESSSGANRLI